MARFLFADSTPFPLQDDFLDTLVAAVDTGVELLELDARARHASDLVAIAEVEADSELSSLEELSEALFSTLGEFDGTEEASGAAAEICRTSRAVIAAKRARIESRRELRVRSAREQYRAGDILGALSRLFGRHRLPGTEWQIAWRADDAANASITATTPIGLTAELDIDLPADSPCNKPIHVGDMTSELKPFAPGASDRIRGWFVTELTQTPERTWMRLTTSGTTGDSARGIVVTLGNNGAPSNMTPIYDSPSQPIALLGGNLRAFQQLRDQALEALAPLVHHRARVRAASFRGEAVQAIERPRALAKALVDFLAPLTCEIRRRSAAGELTLKRDLADGKREEIFVSDEALQRRVSQLPGEQRLVFEPMGLEPQSTAAGEIVVVIDYAA